jgi:putative transcriptional regulator
MVLSGVAVFLDCIWGNTIFLLGASNMKNRIRALRKAKNLRQEDLSDILGVTRQTINAIENDKYDPTLSLAFGLAEVLGTTVDELFFHGSDNTGGGE